jgi:asparagine synthase (glutamine-hydrolysing)
VFDEMIADVPLGAFLSGGIDSPLICHFAQQHLQSKLYTFCIGSDSKVHDEGSLAQQYASLIGTEHLLKQVHSNDLIATFNEIMQIGQEPMADFSIIPTYWVSKLAKQQVTVALSGDGGDELFFGYERFASIAKNIQFQHYPYPIKALLYKGDQYLTHNKRLNSVLLANKQGKAHQALHSRFTNQWINNIFPDLQNIKLPTSYSTYDYSNTRSISELLQKMRKAEFYGMMQKTLRKVDLASMGNSLEVRVPFLNKSFIVTSLRIDPLLSFDLHKKKELLKKLLKQKYPTAPIDNIKRGFTVPFGDWLRNDLFIENIRNNYVNNLDKFGIKESALQSILTEQKKGSDHKWAIFTLMNLHNA